MAGREEAGRCLDRNGNHAAPWRKVGVGSTLEEDRCRAKKIILKLVAQVFIHPGGTVEEGAGKEETGRGHSQEG